MNAIITYLHFLRFVFYTSALYNEKVSLIFSGGIDMKTIAKLTLSAAIASLLSIAYRFSFFHTEWVRELLMDIGRRNLLFFIVWLAIIALLTLIVSYCVQNFHTISGSGLEHITTIHSVDSVAKEPFLIPIKFVVGLLCAFGNLGFGSIGIIAYMAAVSSKLFSKLTKAKKEHEQMFIYSGAAAALTAFFGIYFSGAIFIIERYKLGFKNIPMVLAILLPSLLMCQLHHLFFPTDVTFSSIAASATPDFYLTLIFLTILIFVLELIFKKLTVFLLVFYQRHHITAYVKIGTAFLLTTFFAIFFPQTTPNIYNFILSLINTDINVMIVLAFFVVQFVLTAVNFSSSASVGIFFSALFLGGFLGAMFGTLCIEYLDISSLNYPVYVFCGMAVFFALANGTPISAIAFIFELSGHFYFPVILAVIFAKLLSPLTNFIFQLVNKNNQKKAYES